MDEIKPSDQVIVEVYPLIRAADPCWPVVIYGIIIALVTLCGILSNLSVIFVTIRTKTFRGTANILLALYSFCEIVHLSGNFLSIFTAFSGHYFMPFKNAFYFLLMPIAGGICAVNLMLFIGIERLFVVLFPFKAFRRKLFLQIVLFLTLIFAIAYVIVILNIFDDFDDSINIFGSFCEVVRLIFGSVKYYIIVLIGLNILILTIILYALIAVVVNCRNASSNANSAQFKCRIFRSLLTIVCVNLGGYLIKMLFFTLKPIIMLNENPMTLWHEIQIVGILLHISSASNAPILYWNSSDYREAFQRNFAFLFNEFRCCKSSAILPQN